MCETTSSWNTMSLQTELLRQDNSALRAEVARLKQELSRSQGTVRHSGSIAIELRVIVEEAQRALRDARGILTQYPSEVLSDGSIFVQLTRCQQQLQKVSKLSTVLQAGTYPDGVSGGMKKRTVWSYLSAPFRGRMRDRYSEA